MWLFAVTGIKASMAGLLNYLQLMIHVHISGVSLHTSPPWLSVGCLGCGVRQVWGI